MSESFYRYYPHKANTRSKWLKEKESIVNTLPSRIDFLHHLEHSIFTTVYQLFIMDIDEGSVNLVGL